MSKKWIDLVVSFDTTGSMFPCLAEVKRKAVALVRRLFQEVPNLRVGVIVHGDYCDAGISYVTKTLDLTTSQSAVVSFIQTVGSTGGGDAAECYELVLNEVRSFSWAAEKNRVLVLLGDNVPHGVNYPANRKHLDWRNEARMLAEMGVRAYTVQCLNIRGAEPFYRGLAEITGGLYLRLDQFRHIETLLLGVAFQQAGDGYVERFEQEVCASGGTAYGVRNIFDILRGRTAAGKPAAATRRRDGLTPVDPARFQVFDVEGTPSIRDFVESMGIRFEKGCGFYPHVTRPETIQENKEVILEDLNTGEMFTGSEARERIGLPFGCRGTVKPNPIPGFRVWVQSTSVNRILRERLFLYEVPASDRCVG